MRIPLERDGSEPLYRQIEAFLKQQIQSGALPAETRLPASRDLAGDLGVSRITVTNAYAELETEGLVYSKLGSGTYVALHPSGVSRERLREAKPQDWPLWQQELLSRTWLPAYRQLEQLMASIAHPDLISFAGGSGAVDLFPVDEFRKTLTMVLRRDRDEAFVYGDRAGYLPLRETISLILSAQGIPTHPDEVLITSGSQQGISLTARLLLRPGEEVLVESPTYVGAIDLFRCMEVLVRGIPMDENGMLMDRVEEALRTGRPRLIYTIPNFHNPSGLCLSGLRRRQLIALAERYDVPVLEDDCFGDLRYEGRALPALKALDPGGRVIYINTFSKMLMPGLRVGVLVASGPVYERLLSLKYATDLASPNPLQRALEAYVSVGRYEAHLRKACRHYQQRRDAMVAALRQYLPADAQWQQPQGGLFLWLRLPDELSAMELLPMAGQEGVAYTPGFLFFPGERKQPFLRLNFAMHTPERIVEGIRRLAVACARVMEQAHLRRRQPTRRHVSV